MWKIIADLIDIEPENPDGICDHLNVAQTLQDKLRFNIRALIARHIDALQSEENIIELQEEIIEILDRAQSTREEGQKNPTILSAIAAKRTQELDTIWARKHHFHQILESIGDAAIEEYIQTLPQSIQELLPQAYTEIYALINQGEFQGHPDEKLLKKLLRCSSYHRPPTKVKQ